MSIYRCIQPEYVRHFQCDGKACDARCCRGWNVQLDSNALARFQKAPEGLRQEILPHLGKNEVTGLPEIVRETDACPFLGPDLLCSLQKRCGEGFLADVCAEYPRCTTQFPDLLERTLCMTCPVAARLALLSEAPMQFEECELQTERETYFQQADDEKSIQSLHFFDLQRAGIRILQDRSRSMPDRFARLEHCLAEAERLLADGKGEQISGLADETSHKNDLREPPPSFSNRLPTVLQVLSGMIGKSVDDDPLTQEFLSCISRILLPDDIPQEELAPRWDKLYDIHAQEVLGTYGHILENYFVNEYFSALYPCAAVGSFAHNARILAMLYYISELLLLCQSAEKGSISETDILSTLRWLAVRTNHFVGYVAMLSELLNTMENAPM
ncbi:MAG: flagellin lysine-N-methylase [Selenomonadaceae bacterium]|nr:flagellin lysine-N-methylase [Selenomonadaceae bacterium]